MVDSGEVKETKTSESSSPASLSPAGRGARLLSLDVFRGATIAAMLLVNNPGTWSALYAPLRHAEWHGWTFTDTIFPFFLWIVGVSMTLSFARRLGRGDGRAALLLHVCRRSAILFLLGIFLAGFPRFDFSTIRIPGVLQRIAVCYLCAAVIYLFSRLRGQLLWTAGLLGIYWVLMKLVPVPGYGAGVLEKIGNFAQYIDSIMLSGHMWSQSKVWDPEGIVSTIPAIATTLLGVLTGRILQARVAPAEKTAWIFIAGNTLMLAGAVMSLWLPVNKSLWTSSYAVLMAGLAANCFAFCYWVIDVKGWRRWTQPLVAYGMNAILIFVLAGLLAKTTILIKLTGADGKPVSLARVVFETAYLPLASPVNASLLYALTYVALFWGFGSLLYRRGWFVKI